MRKTKLGQELITAMNELVSVPGDPSKWSAARVARFRKLTLRVSQPILAIYLGVSPGTVKAWEQGAKAPTGSARRLLDLLWRDPERVMGLIRVTATAQQETQDE